MRTNNSEKGALRVKEASEDNAAQTQGRIAGLRQVERATREGRCSKGIQPEIGLRKAVRERARERGWQERLGRWEGLVLKPEGCRSCKHMGW